VALTLLSPIAGVSDCFAISPSRLVAVASH
jgi:hypothetical protein